jgi:hypothetical protein
MLKDLGGNRGSTNTRQRGNPTGTPIIITECTFYRIRGPLHQKFCPMERRLRERTHSNSLYPSSTGYGTSSKPFGNSETISYMDRNTHCRKKTTPDSSIDTAIFANTSISLYADAIITWRNFRSVTSSNGIEPVKQQPLINKSFSVHYSNWKGRMIFRATAKLRTTSQ